MEELMAKYLANELSEKERTDFESQLIQNEEFSLEFEAYINAWSLHEPAQSPTFNTTAAWAAVSNQISSDNTPVMQVSEKESTRTNEESKKRNTADVIELHASRNKRSNFSFLKIAATLLILAVAGYFITSDLNQKTTSGSEIVYTGSETNEFLLPDGTLVKLNADSKVTYDENFGTDNRNVKLVGQADFDVTRNESLPFIIEAGMSKIEVLGTSFDIAAYPGKEAKLIVTEGTVAFASLNKADVKEILTKGQQAILDVKGETIEVSEVTEEVFENWWIRDFQFEDAPLADIFKRLEKAYQVEIVYPEAIKDCEWTHYNDKDFSIDQVFELFQASFKSVSVSSGEKENQIKLEGTACDN